MTLSRRKERGLLIAHSRKTYRAEPLCWRCGMNVGAHMHEMLNRGLTVGNEEARELSFDHRLTVLLCPACHEMAPRFSVENHLWRILYAHWGYDQVREAYDAVQAVMTTKLPELPDE